MTHIKLCGLSRPCDIEAVNALKPEYIGFVFAPKSKRYVTLEHAVELKGLLAPGIQAADAFEYLARTEGIISAIESAHAVAYARTLAPAMEKEQIIVITISDRGDKDCAAIARYRGEELHK